MSEVGPLRDHVLRLLRGEGAHIGFDEAIEGLPATARGARLAGSPHTPWRLLEHMRIAQWDILEFCRDPEHVSPDFPGGYWPPSDEPPDAGAWERSVAAFREDLAAMQRLVAASDDLLAPIPHAGQALLREALLLADHNAYHLGQLVLIGRSLSEPVRTPANIYPGLSYADAPAAIDWLCRVFGFRRRLVVASPDGGVRHSELSLGPGVIMVGSARPEERRFSPRDLPGLNQVLSVHVDDPDAHCARARAEGAEIVHGVEETSFGARGYAVRDLEGHAWYFANYRPGVYWEQGE